MRPQSPAPLFAVLLLLALVAAACADLPTSKADPQVGSPLANCYGTVSGGVHCDPVKPDWTCDPWEDLDWCDDDGACATSAPRGPEHPGGPDRAAPAGCPGGGSGPGGGGPGGDSGAPTLTCSPAAIGQVASCTVTGGTVARWNFGTNGDLFPGPEGGQSWSGVAVKGGTVGVELTDGKILTSQLIVSPRGWRWGSSHWTFTQGGGPTGCDTTAPAPGTGILWGWNRTASGACNDDAGRYQPNLRTSPHAGYTIGQVTSGPNAGFWYVTSVRYTMDRGSNINPSLTAGGSRHLLTDPGQAATCRTAMGLAPVDPVYVNFYTFNEVCMGVDVDGILGAVWLHEGFGSTGSNGHESVSRTEAAKVQNDPYVHGDTLASPDPMYLQAVMPNGVWDQNVRVTNLGAAHTHVHGNWSGNMQYWMWNPSTGRYELTTLGANI